MKRANGTGSIVRLSGSRRRPYAVRVSGRDEYGQVIQKTLSYHRTASEAQEALEKYNQDKAHGAAPRVDTMKMTVGQIYDAWSAREYQTAGAQSIRSHKAAWGRVGRFADVPIVDVTIDMWQSILDEDGKNNASESKIRNDAILIKALVMYALKRDILTKNVYEFLEIPSAPPKKKKGAFNDAQIAQLKRMAADGEPYADIALMLCYTGFRISEFVGLNEASYHADGNFLQYGIKTDAGRDRIVPVSAVIAPYISNWLRSDHRSSDWYRARLRPIFAAIGEPEATPHWCRHTFATRLNEAKVDLTVRKWLLGHVTNDITERYTHQSLTLMRDAIDRLS